MRYFCTYFDRHYLPRGLALYRSLQQHCPSFKLWALCMDSDAYGVLSTLALPGLHTISLPEFEQQDPPLRAAKENRSRIEYYFTCTPSLPIFIFDQFPEVDLLTYLDADLYFFADPAPVFDEIADHSIAVIEHRFPPYLRDRERFGVYNVGWVSFRRDSHAAACLAWWRERCLEWCYDRCEDGRFGDQKYLDQWPGLFTNLVVLQHKGANLAPWNLTNYRLREDAGQVWVDDQPLIVFHFHGLKRIRDWLYDTCLAEYRVKRSDVLRQRVYAPYIRTLVDMSRFVSIRFAQASPGGPIRGHVHLPIGARHFLPPWPRPSLVVRRVRSLMVVVHGHAI
jgi:hypothetical protein